MAKFSSKNIAEAIYQSAKNKTGAELDSALKMAVEFLAKKNLLSKTPEILNYITQLSDTEQNIVRAKVSSKNPLSKSAEEKIETLLKARHKSKTPRIEWKEDKSLLGGVKIEAGGEILDLSLKHRVDRLQEYLMTN
ncbi:MAG: F0F1 ATP synthase subunit delta [Patescibacteria group bacterium]